MLFCAFTDVTNRQDMKLQVLVGGDRTLNTALNQALQIEEQQSEHSLGSNK